MAAPRIRIFLISPLLTVATLALLASGVHAAVVRGRLVALADRAPVAGAKVVLFGHGLKQGAVADGLGAFKFDAAPESDMILRVQAAGFRTLERTIVVRPGTLDLGEVVMSAPTDPLLDIGTSTRVRGESLVATIRPLRDTLHVGERPRFEVRIRNASADTVILVRRVEGSDISASPLVSISIAGPPGGFVAEEVAAVKGPGVAAEDFVAVPPGEAFDPYAGTDGAAARGSVTKPGRYTATIRYATRERDPQPWLASGCSDCTMDDAVRAELTRVPFADVVGKVTFTVLP